MTTDTLTVDLSRLGSLPEKLKDLFGADPVIVKARFENGRVSADTVNAIGGAIAERLEKSGAPPELVAQLRKRVEETAANPATVLDDGQRKEREAIQGAIRSALKLLDDVPDLIKAIGVRHAGFTQNAIAIHKFSSIIGMCQGSVLTALGELKGALGALDHAFECPCMNGGEHGDDKPSEPAAAEPAAAPEGT